MTAEVDNRTVRCAQNELQQRGRKLASSWSAVSTKDLTRRVDGVQEQLLNVLIVSSDCVVLSHSRHSSDDPAVAQLALQRKSEQLCPCLVLIINSLLRVAVRLSLLQVVLLLFYYH